LNSNTEVQYGQTRSRDRDVAAEVLRAAYGSGLRMAGAPGTREFVMRHATTNAFSYAEVELPAQLSFTNDARSGVVVMAMTGGRTERVCGSQRGAFAAGDVWLANQPDRPYTAHTDDLAASTITVAPWLLADAVRTVDPRGKRPLRFASLTPATARHAALWEHTCRYVQGICDPALPTSSLVTGAAARMLAAQLLHVFPNNVSGQEPAAADHRDAGPATVARASTYMDEHADADISLADIAQAAHVTPRALQYAFRRHLETTPLEYLRRVRLDLAHQELVRTTPGKGVTVAGIAARWGFSNSGRFTALHRQTYGVSPLTVLHDHQSR
jgi:AraC-like DNA-binding protein